ncbi:MAG: ThiF family adenylyltransferase, partial [Acidimicrobiales bacterium]
MSQIMLPETDLLIGSGFFDESTGLSFEFHNPRSSPDVWTEYLDGATAAYARYGIGEAIHRSELEDGAGVTIFVVGRRADGTVKAGLRFHGPLNQVEDSLSLVEMALSPEVPRLTAQIRRFVPHGVIEIKGAWAAAKGAGPHSMFKSFGRCIVYTMHWLRCEFAIATMAEQHLEPALGCGAHHLSADSVPFPSEEYRTRLMVWRRSRMIDTTEADQIFLERTELGHLAHPQLREASAVLEDNAWRPLILDCRSRSDRAIALRLTTTGTRTIDRLNDQRAELTDLRPPVPAEALDEAPRFVYYPWRKTLCKIVGPQGFDLLRLDRNRNKITTEEQARLRELRIGIVGLSVGHSIAHLLAMGGLCGELRLADFDDIAITNLNRIPVSLLDLGVNKTVAAARRIAEIDPYLSVSVWRRGITEENVGEFLDGLDLVIEECDSLDVKLLLR